MRRLAILAACGLLIAGCRAVLDFNGVIGAGPVRSEAREVSAFRGVTAGGGIRLTVTIGAERSVEVRAEENLLPIIDTTVSDGILTIDSSESFSTSRGVEVTIVTPTLDAITLSGGAQGEVRALSSDALALELSGGAQLRASGTARTITLDASGGAQAFLFDVQAEAAQVSISGGARGEVTSSGTVTGSASGGAHLSVHGDATVSVEATGGASVDS